MPEERIVVPSHAIVNISNINKTMSVLYKKFLGKEVDKDELSKEVGLKLKALGRILAMVHSFNLIEYTRGRKKVKINATGTEYAHQLTEGDEAKAKKILSEQIDKTALWKKVNEFIVKECAGKHGTISGLGYFLMKAQNKTWDPTYQKIVAEKSCEILSYAGNIDYNTEEGTFTLRDLGKEAEEKMGSSKGEEFPSLPEGVTPAGVTINVNLDLDYRMPADLQREYMKWLQSMAARSGVRFVIKEKKSERQKED